MLMDAIEKQTVTVWDSSTRVEVSSLQWALELNHRRCIPLLQYHSFLREMALPICPGVDSVCRFGSTLAVGYRCVERICEPCPLGSYGSNGRSCVKCPLATWSTSVASTFCNTTFEYSKPGSQKFYIPAGVTRINVKLWGGGGGGGDSLSKDVTFKPNAGGGGGFVSCNLTVSSETYVYFIVAGGGLTTSGRAAGGKICVCQWNLRNLKHWKWISIFFLVETAVLILSHCYPSKLFSYVTKTRQPLCVRLGYYALRHYLPDNSKSY